MGRLMALAAIAATLVTAAPFASRAAESRASGSPAAAPGCRGETLPPAAVAAAATAASSPGPRLGARPMWLWESPKVLLDARARADLLAFCACQGIDTLWMQVVL